MPPEWGGGGGGAVRPTSCGLMVGYIGDLVVKLSSSLVVMMAVAAVGRGGRRTDGPR